jgi:hypothetical protein
MGLGSEARGGRIVATPRMASKYGNKGQHYG